MFSLDWELGFALAALEPPFGCLSARPRSCCCVFGVVALLVSESQRERSQMVLQEVLISFLFLVHVSRRHYKPSRTCCCSISRPAPRFARSWCVGSDWRSPNCLYSLTVDLNEHHRNPRHINISESCDLPFQIEEDGALQSRRTMKQHTAKALWNCWQANGWNVLWWEIS